MLATVELGQADLEALLPLLYHVPGAADVGEVQAQVVGTVLTGAEHRVGALVEGELHVELMLLLVLEVEPRPDTTGWHAGHGHNLCSICSNNANADKQTSTTLLSTNHLHCTLHCHPQSAAHSTVLISPLHLPCCVASSRVHCVVQYSAGRGWAGAVTECDPLHVQYLYSLYHALLN